MSKNKLDLNYIRNQFPTFNDEYSKNLAFFDNRFSKKRLSTYSCFFFRIDSQKNLVVC